MAETMIKAIDMSDGHGRDSPIPSVVDQRNAGIAVAIKLAFIPPQQIPQIILTRLTRDQKCRGNGGVTIILHDSMDKVGTDGLSRDQRPDTLCFRFGQIFLFVTDSVDGLERELKAVSGYGMLRVSTT